MALIVKLLFCFSLLFPLLMTATAPLTGFQPVSPVLKTIAGALEKAGMLNLDANVIMEDSQAPEIPVIL